MLSPHRMSANSHRRRQKISNREHDLERSQLTSNDLITPQMTSKKSSPFMEKVEPNILEKSKLRGGGKTEINDESLDGWNFS